PGGESTTIGKLMRQYGFIEALRDFSAAGKPIFGTCAGLICIAKELMNNESAHLGLMDIKVASNAFGRQRESFETNLIIEGIAEDVRAVFNRTTFIEEVGTNVQVLSTYQSKIVAAKQGHLLATSFHPVLTDDFRVHLFFVEMIKQ